MSGHDAVSPSPPGAHRRRKERRDGEVTAGRRWLAANTVEIAFGLVLVATSVHWVLITRDSWFWLDEWVMAWQMRDLGNVVEPFNDHLSILILGLYRLLLNVVGFSTYTPYRLAGVVSLAAVSLIMFVHARRMVGPGIAALMALILLWQPELSIEPGGLNHSLALVGGISCAIGLTGRESRHDLVVAGGLLFSLASAGGGVAVAAAAIVHTICTRGSLNRWLAVLVPSIAWAAWWRVMVPPDPADLIAARPDLLHLGWGALDHASRSFDSLALGNRVAGYVLLAVFVVHALWRLRDGLVASANVLAWSAAVFVWWFGLMHSRWLFLGDVKTFRYELVSVTFILLAVLPRRRPAWVGDLTTDARRRVLLTVAVLAVAAVLTLSVHPDLERFAQDQASYGRGTRALVALIAIDDPPVVPDDFQRSLGLGYTDARRIRAVLRRFGAPAFVRDPDRLTLEAADVRIQRRPASGPPPGCAPLVGAQQVAADQPIVLHSGSGDPVVEVRRHGERWVSLGRLAAGRPAEVVLPSLAAPGDWSLRAEGACAATSVPS